MIEIIFFGRGGQGAVTASQILATAAFTEGKYAQAFPYFGGERKGAAVTAYARISETPIEVRNPIEHPDIVVILDYGLFKTSNPLGNLKPNGIAVINTHRSTEEIKRYLKKEMEVYTIDATGLSEKIYGHSSIPKTNMAMLGALSACGQVTKLDSILAVIDQYFTGDDVAKTKQIIKLAFEATARSQ
jgi:2-oxoacid:acceptor oxidoreductase gamma subunit (pyruvate/2-ketoisovalerate family)